jgi:hypothetical protein
MSEKITSEPVKKQPWLKEAITAARVIRQVRRSGETEKLAIVQESELQDMRLWLAKRDHENQLMQACIIGGTKYISPCNWCEENKDCTREQHGGKGCDGWWLRFLTEEEEKSCAERSNEQFTERGDQRAEDGVSGTVC